MSICDDNHTTKEEKEKEEKEKINRKEKEEKENKKEEKEEKDEKINRKEKDEKEKVPDVKNNLGRQIYAYLIKFMSFKQMRGLAYYNLHCGFIFLITFITIFSTSKIELTILLAIISLDAVSVIYLHECPLTSLEKKYLGYTSCDERDGYLRQMNIMYNCDHTYEKQIELLINIWCIIAMKCLLIIFLNMSNIKLYDVNNIYFN